MSPFWRNASARRSRSINEDLTGVIRDSKNFISDSGIEVGTLPPIGIKRNRHTNAPIFLILGMCGKGPGTWFSLRDMPYRISLRACQKSSQNKRLDICSGIRYEKEW